MLWPPQLPRCPRWGISRRSIAPVSAGAVARAVVPSWQEGLAPTALSPDYRRILSVLRARSGSGERAMRAKEIAVVLGPEPVPAKVEGARSKVKRLAERGWVRQKASGKFSDGQRSEAGPAACRAGIRAAWWGRGVGPGCGPSAWSSTTGSRPRWWRAGFRSRGPSGGSSSARPSTTQRLGSTTKPLPGGNRAHQPGPQPLPREVLVSAHRPDRGPALRTRPFTSHRHQRTAAPDTQVGTQLDGARLERPRLGAGLAVAVGTGSIPCARRIFHTVEGATLMPRERVRRGYAGSPTWSSPGPGAGRATGSRAGSGVCRAVSVVRRPHGVVSRGHGATAEPIGERALHVAGAVLGEGHRGPHHTRSRPSSGLSCQSHPPKDQRGGTFLACAPRLVGA